MTDSREVDPDLVRSSGLEPYAEHRMSRRTLERLEVRDGWLPHARGHEGRVVGVAAYGGVDRPRPGLPASLHDHPVDAAHPPGRYHLDEPGVRRLAFREHHQARGIAVEPVDDPWSGWVFPSPNAPFHERVYERT